MEVNEKEREEALVYSWLECFVCVNNRMAAFFHENGLQNLKKGV